MSAVADRPLVQVPLSQHFLLSDIDWPTYVAFGDLLQGRHVRLTYDRGELEFMTLSPRHKHSKRLIARFIDTLTEILDIDIAGYGSMTFRREDLERGFEPDECYWIAHETLIRGHTEIDLTKDPPPDLIVEVEITRNVLDRLPIFAALGVPEVWRWDGNVLHVVLLQADGKYAESEQSRSFPFLHLKEFAQFLIQNPEQSETKLIQRFRSWVLQERANWKTA